VLSAPEKELLGEYARQVWGEIAYDVMTMVKENDKKDSIPRDEVIELVCDAGRLEEAVELALKRARHQAAKLAMLERLSLYMQSDARDLEKVVKPAFTHARYGL
jgi:hypothetical protein